MNNKISKDDCILRLSKNVTLYKDFLASESVKHDMLSDSSSLLTDHFFRNFFGIEFFDYILDSYGSTLYRLGVDFHSQSNLHDISNTFVEFFNNSLDDFSDFMEIIEIISYNDDCDLEYYLTKEVEHFIIDISDIYTLITKNNIDYKDYIRVYSILSKSMGTHLLPIIEMTNLFIKENIINFNEDEEIAILDK